MEKLQIRDKNNFLLNKIDSALPSFFMYYFEKFFPYIMYKMLQKTDVIPKIYDGTD